MRKEIIDFHTHPYIDKDTFIGCYADGETVSWKDIKKRLEPLGITKICGSVIYRVPNCQATWKDVEKLNDMSLKLRDLLGDFYIPGYHVHAKHIDESIKEIDRMKSEGVNLVGELVPSRFGWDYNDEGFEKILSALDNKDIVLSFHSTSSSDGVNDVLDN